MASSPPTYNNSHSQILPKDQESPYSTPLFRPAVHRISSFSLSSPSQSWDSSSSSEDEYFPFSPLTPLKLKGIPFSWEQIPGIPKHKGGLKKNKQHSSGRHLLPLPPAGDHTNSSTTKMTRSNKKTISTKKCNTSSRFQKDPFFAALVECSKDDHDNHGTSFGNILKGSSKIITRVLSDRLGLIDMYSASCKSTCAVSESIVYLPRPSPYNLRNRY